MTSRASGTFIVTVTPQAAEPDIGDPSVARMSLYKKFEGDLEAIALGQMLATRAPVAGSAAYVALDRVSGILHGRSGSFSLQHSGVMNRGAAQLTISVVPDSATGELTGLSGVLSIEIVAGQHFYQFEYSLPELD